MRNLISLVITVLLVLSCNTESEHYDSKFKPDSVLFDEASEMKGLGNFVIGKTTINDILEINKQIDDLNQRSYSYNPEFKKEESWQNCLLVKQYGMYKYSIGEVEISDFKLYFYQDTLYKIACNTSDIIKDAFTRKYGEGVIRSSSIVTRLKKGTKVDASELIVWENYAFITTFDEKIRSGFDEHNEFRNDFIIETKSDRIKENILNCSNIQFRLDELKKDSIKQKQMEQL